MIKLLSAFNAEYYLLTNAIASKYSEDRAPKTLVFVSAVEYNELKNEVKGLASNFLPDILMLV